MENNSPKRNNFERKALLVGAIVNLIMAISGWVAYYLSNSQALLLDGNFSFIVFLSTLVAMKISTIKEKRTGLFPFGQFVFEALYALLKGVMIIGVLIMATTDNITKIMHYLDGQKTPMLDANVILVYSVLMVILCFFLAFYYKYQNNKQNNSSTMLRAEYSVAMIDGFMSAGIGIALVGVTFIDVNSNFGFLIYIGDAILVVVLCLLMGKGPFVLVRDSFIEIAGGTLQDENEKRNIESIVRSCLPNDELLEDTHISKTGSSYLIIAYFNAQHLESIGYKEVTALNETIREALTSKYQNVVFGPIIA